MKIYISLNLKEITTVQNAKERISKREFPIARIVRNFLSKDMKMIKESIKSLQFMLGT